MVGYTDKQAERLLHRIDVAAARIDDDVAKLMSIVPDNGHTTSATMTVHEEIQTYVWRLKDMVQRRKRSAAVRER